MKRWHIYSGIWGARKIKLKIQSLKPVRLAATHAVMWCHSRHCGVRGLKEWPCCTVFRKSHSQTGAWWTSFWTLDFVSLSLLQDTQGEHFRLGNHPAEVDSAQKEEVISAKEAPRARGGCWMLTDCQNSGLQDKHEEFYILFPTTGQRQRYGHRNALCCLPCVIYIPGKEQWHACAWRLRQKEKIKLLSLNMWSCSGAPASVPAAGVVIL